MPTPKFEMYSPNKNDSLETRWKDLYNAYYDQAQYMQWLMSHLDSKNVLEAATVKKLTAEQINVVQGIVLGANATINWGELPTLPTAAQVGARPDSWMPTAGDVGALPWNTYIPVVPEYIHSTYIDQTNVISPFISGGVLTGALFRTAINGERLEINTTGLTTWDENENKTGIAMENGPYGYSELQFFQYGLQVGQFAYDSYGGLYLGGMNDAIMYPTGIWDFSQCEIRNLNVIARFG